MSLIAPRRLGFEPMSPTMFLVRAEAAYRERAAVVEGSGAGRVERTFGELADRSRRLAGGLVSLGVRPGDRVSIWAPNSSAVLESQFGVPWAGGVVNTINTRLSPDELAYIIDHAESSVLIVDQELEPIAREALRQASTRPAVVVSGGSTSEYEDLLAGAEPIQHEVDDELSLLALNYTSGTTGRPKGVMYSHRGAYLQALAMMNHARLTTRSRYLWTLPLFHCNGWCFPWAVTGAGGRHVLVRRPDPDLVWQAIEKEGVTHLSGAPTVLSRLAVGRAGRAVPEDEPIQVTTGGAPPSPSLLGRLSAVGFDVTHLYGLTETYGPAAICDWLPEWDDLDEPAQARLKARQGVGNVAGHPVRVWDNGVVPSDGATIGEVQLRGNNVMLGYYRDPEATAAATCEGWLRSGDLGVVHPDGYVELRDRAKDVIISGGENITSVEVEQALDSHPAVLESAVVGAPDEEWGEIVVAFVTLAPGGHASEAELIAHVKSRIARFKAPRRVVFVDLPKTASGKVQKFQLRQNLAAPTDRS